MSRFQLFLLRWIVDRALYTRGEHRLFEVIARRAQECYYEDNLEQLEGWAHERMAVGFHNARTTP